MPNASLLVRIYSLSYRSNLPGDPCGNGGGFVFDCRSLPNPGRLIEYADLTGLHRPVIEYLEKLPETGEFLQSVGKIVENTAESYRNRGFTDLMVSFGCTGGQHRSVYFAEKTGEYLNSKGFNTRVIHWELQKNQPHHAAPCAMILAAGEGTRLRPLTDDTPKALMEAGGKTMLDWNIEALSKAGFKEITVNAYHLKEQIVDYVKSNYTSTSPKIHLSQEETLLGTGGGVKRAARYLHSPLPVMIHNVDIYTEFDLREIYRQFNPADFAAVICQERASSRSLLFDESGCLIGRRTEIGDIMAQTVSGEIRNLAFAGIHILSPEAVETFHTCNSPDIIDYYLEQAKKGKRIRAVIAEGKWFDMGTALKLGKLREFVDGRR